MSPHLSLSTSSISTCHLTTLTHSSSSLAQLNNKQLLTSPSALCRAGWLVERHAMRNGFWSTKDAIFWLPPMGPAMEFEGVGARKCRVRVPMALLLPRSAAARCPSWHRVFVLALCPHCPWRLGAPRSSARPWLWLYTHKGHHLSRHPSAVGGLSSTLVNLSWGRVPKSLLVWLRSEQELLA